MADLPAGAGAAPHPEHLQQFLWLRCADAGWWEPAVKPGEKVAEGQLLGPSAAWTAPGSCRRSSLPRRRPDVITSSPAVAAEGLLLGLGAI